MRLTHYLAFTQLLLFELMINCLADSLFERRNVSLGNLSGAAVSSGSVPMHHGRSTQAGDPGVEQS